MMSQNISKSEIKEMNSKISEKNRKILDGLALSYEKLVEYKRKNGYYMVYMRDGKIVKEIPK